MVKYFKNQPLTLIENSLVKDHDQYSFASKPVKIVRVVGNLDEIHEKYAGRFFISVCSVKFISEDSATVFSILHAGNTTYFLGLRKQENNWLIRSREYGKF